MSDEMIDPRTAWINQCHNIAWELGEGCAELRTTRPETCGHELEHVMVSLMTELWDRNYSQTEIRTAYLAALEQMPQYAAESERRSDEGRVRRDGKTIADD